jgi:O-Glycosyl hydrolase
VEGEAVPMNKSNHLLWRVARIVAVFASLIAGCAPTQQYVGPMEPTHTVLLFHPETTFQAMTGFGAGFNTSEWINKIKDPQDWAKAYNLLYDPQYNGVRLNIVRLTVSPDAQELSQSSPLYAQGFKYDWGGDDITLSMWNAIQPVRARIKPIIYAVPFTPPVSWKIATAQNHFNSQCNPLLNPHACGGVLDPNRYQDYAEYLTDFVDYYHRILNVDIDVLSIQNEPGISAPWQSCIWTGDELKKFLTILQPALQARGLNPKLMLSEGTNWTGAAAHLAPTVLDAAALPLLGIMASHSYGDPQDSGRALFAGAWEKYKLPVWMSEMSLMDLNNPKEDDPTMDAALTIAGYIHRDLALARASAWIYCFAIFTSTFKGSMGVLSPADEGNG